MEIKRCCATCSSYDHLKVNCDEYTVEHVIDCAHDVVEGNNFQDLCKDLAARLWIVTIEDRATLREIIKGFIIDEFGDLIMEEYFKPPDPDIFCCEKWR